LAEEKNAPFWKVGGNLNRGTALIIAGEAASAIDLIAAGIAAWRSMGVTMWATLGLSNLARAHSELGQFEDAWRCIGEAISTAEETLERWWLAEVYRTAGDIALRSESRDETRAEGYFERALDVARAQQAKSLELRAAMSLARLWRDQGKVQQASELLAPVYGWFTEGFDTRDLKEAKALLEELAA
jgi:predicted ATPase